MPELPEVEITRRRIEPLLARRRIARLETTAASYFFLTPPAALRRRLPGRSVTGLHRHGKYLLADLDDGERLLLHLGMTGQLFSSHASSPRLLSASARAAMSASARATMSASARATMSASARARVEPQAQRDFEPDQHTHLRLYFEDGGPAVFLRDVRKFGKVRLLAAGDRDARLDRLGPDALGVEGPALFEALRGRRAPIKALLLDQALLAGVGNIYADEALFLAGVRPGRAAGRVTRRECDALAAGLRSVLQRSIDTGGSSISDFVGPDGRDGAYQDERHVYARTREACLRCGTPIQRRLVAQRSSHFCPSCQR